MAERRPLVSVVMPAFNAERYIGIAIDSVLSQRYREWELVVVDDGSTDGTAAVAQACARRDSRVRVLQQANGGVAAARNAGIAAARGEFVAPLDADDLWLPDNLALQVQCLLEAPPEVGVAYAWSADMDEQGRFSGKYVASDDEGDVYAALIFGNLIGNASATVFRRACIDRCGGYDPTLRARGGEGCEDYDLYLRLARHYEFVRVPRLLIGYRRLGTSMSCDWKGMARSHRYVIDTVRARHPFIPRALLRWCNAGFYQYLAGQCTRADRVFAAMWCLARAAASDLNLIRDQYFQRVVRRTVRRVRTVSHLGAPRRPRKRVGKGVSVAEMERELCAYPRSKDPRTASRLAFARAWLVGAGERQSLAQPGMEPTRQRNGLHEGFTG